MMEIDSPRIALKIAAAEDAISKRLNELPLNQANAEELQALLTASKKLDGAKAEAVAKYPGCRTYYLIGNIKLDFVLDGVDQESICNGHFKSVLFGEAMDLCKSSETGDTLAHRDRACRDQAPEACGIG